MTQPANNPNVLSVSAVGDSGGACGAPGLNPYLKSDDITITDDIFAFISCFGPVVKIAAPGVNILSVWQLYSLAEPSRYARHSNPSRGRGIRFAIRFCVRLRDLFYYL